MTQAERIISKFGGNTALAKALGHRFSSTVQTWKESGFIPAKHHQAVVDAANKLGIQLFAEDFLVVDLPSRVQTDGAAA